MSNQKTTWLAWALCGVVMVGAVFSFVLTASDLRIRADVFALINALLNALYTIAFGVVGALILSRQTRNRIGWLLMVIAVSMAGPGTLQIYFQQSAELTPAVIFASWAR